MQRTPHILVMAVALSGVASQTMHAEIERAEARITIRTYAAVRIPPADQTSAGQVAAAILRTAGLSVTWQPCGGALSPTIDDPCAAPVGRTELAIRFVRMPQRPGPGLPLSLGYSLVDSPARLGVLATIYVDRVTRLAGQCGVDHRTLLGRTMAHEIGHLLLGTNEHRPAGLMQAVWSCEALKDPSGDWQFAARDAQVIRGAARRRGVELLTALGRGVR